MNSLLVIGKGITGKATSAILDSKVDFHDPAKGDIVEDYTDYCYAFICVPTPSLAGATYDYRHVEDVFVDLLKGGFRGIAVIRSTCDPEFLLKMCEIYEKTIYWPEFLRERHYIDDALNPENVVIGGPEKLTDSLVSLLKKNKHKLLAYWKVTDIVTASIIKLGLNASLASKIAMFNSIREVCENTGADWETVRSVIANDSRIGEGQTFVPGPDKKRGFGGKRLPKDLRTFKKLAKENVYLDSIIVYNNKIRN